jgi:CO/xanthine dehydrogenase FAD-binding subunit
MKAADFEYVRAGSIAEACRRLSEAQGDGKIIAGGQTLVPMMAMRLAKPARLVDINGIAELEGIALSADAVVIRAGTRQADALANDIVKTHLPLLAKAIAQVGHSQTRNRGTVGGSLANADPSAEICLVARTLDATMSAQSVRGARDIAASDFFESAMTTALAPEECLTQARFPVWRENRTGTGFQEVSARKSDFALAAAAAQLSLDAKGLCQRIAIGVGGVEAAPVRAGAAEARLKGTALDDKDVADATATLDGILSPRDDLYASAAYRLRVARALVQRAIAEAKAEALAGAAR